MRYSFATEFYAKNLRPFTQKWRENNFNATVRRVRPRLQTIVDSRLKTDARKKQKGIEEKKAALPAKLFLQSCVFDRFDWTYSYRASEQR